MNSNFTTYWKFRQGIRVKDQVSGFEGTITARVEYLNGCRQYCVEPKLDKEGKVQDHKYIDEGQLESIPKKPKKASRKDVEPPGGQMPNEPD